MQTQIYQQQIPALQQQQQFVSIPLQAHDQFGKSLQKGFSTTQIHKAPLPPKLGKPNKNMIEQNNDALISNGQFRIGNQQALNDNKYFEIKYTNQEPSNHVNQYHWEQNYNQNVNQENLLTKYSQANSQIRSSNYISNPYVITSSNIQILPISIEKVNSVKGLIQSESISTPIYQPEQNISPISKMSLTNNQMPQQQNIDFQAGQYLQNLQDQMKNQIQPIRQEEINTQQDKLKRSYSEYLPKKENNLNEFKQFQIYLSKVTIDPNDYLNFQTSNISENIKESSQESELKIDLKYTNYIDGGGSPFTLNKNPQKPNFFKTYEQLQKQDESQKGVQSFQKQSQEYQKQYNENEKILQPPRKTSVQCQRLKDNNTVTILEIEDYGNYQSEAQNQENQKQENNIQGVQQKNFYNTTNLEKFESFGKLNFDNEGTNQPDQQVKYISNDIPNYNSIVNYNSNGNQDSLIAPQNNNLQLPQGLNLLSSINSNITGNEQSPFCSSFIRQSDLIRKRMNSTDDPQVFFNQTNLHNLFSNPSSTKNARSESNAINIIETHSINNYNSQPQSQLQGQKQAQSNSIQETNEEYTESIVIDQIKNFNQKSIKDTNNSNKIKQDLNRPSLPKPLTNKEQSLFKSKSTENISQNNNYNLSQNDNKSYYLQKAEQILKQLGQNPSFSNNTNITISSQNIANPNLYLTIDEKQSNLTNNMQNSVNQVKLLPKQENTTNLIDSSSCTTERRKKNINQIVQKCVERTQNLIEKLKSKSKKQQLQKYTNILNQAQESPKKIEKSKKHEEIRQSRQKVDELVNEALYRSRQVIQRHFQSKNLAGSPPAQTYDQDEQQDYQDNQVNYNTNYQFQHTQLNYDQNSAQSKDNNTFGYSSNQNKEPLSPNTNLQFQQNNLSDPYQQMDYQIRITPIGSDQKSPLQNEDHQLNSFSKENNSISFDIQAGNSGKSNQLTSQENLSPFKQNLQSFGSSNKQKEESTYINNRQQKQIAYENSNQNFIFEGVLDANGKKQGYGILRNKQNQMVIYEGEWVNDLFDGQGILYNQFPENLQNSFSYSDFNKISNYWKVYEGEFQLGLKNGSGTLVFTNEEKYSGKFINDKVNGEGVFYSNDSKKQPIVGLWVNNILSKIL
ncbi:kinase domain protein (macronuclear) [Tetrahymena thermophila SB210]|uniref:Kinase domain protein n=1 Tax=Tetrahymena thermophila (strain SB210) TaxID=312017 RepID=I7LUG4_TETTS|nr:kinase domain protein [Tetrahymena thermophila SB210]EAR92999.2 kinase domain protein [Tetrahymena thermophila SB210]|eukprot:XP_001013244.2 kinase domain protein [Tetrahymena thermophila SB210]